jgi:hypothetical protein
MPDLMEPIRTQAIANEVVTAALKSLDESVAALERVVMGGTKGTAAQRQPRSKNGSSVSE